MGWYYSFEMDEETWYNIQIKIRINVWMVMKESEIKSLKMMIKTKLNMQRFWMDALMILDTQPKSYRNS